MAKAEVNAYVWWVFLNSWRDNEGLADLTVKTYKISKRLYAFGNWSKFVCTVYVMIWIGSLPEPVIYCLAYKIPASG